MTTNRKRAAWAEACLDLFADVPPRVTMSRNLSLAQSRHTVRQVLTANSS
jgi:hypothetical protein